MTAGSTTIPAKHRQGRGPGIASWALVTAVTILIVATAIWWLTPSSRMKQLPFDAETWRANPVTDANATERETIRQRMSDDLLKSQTLAGLSHAEVVALLGPPNRSTPDELTYYLGDERGDYAMDTESLLIRLQSGRVTTARVISN